MIEVGRICIKTAGREAGKHCVIVSRVNENFVTVTGPKAVTQVKRRRCNVVHLLPLEEKIKIKADAPDEEILQEYEKVGLFSKLGIQLPEKKPK
jgi:large subunit ribosomal protein L14e